MTNPASTTRAGLLTPATRAVACITAAAMALGSIIIYAFGAAWLAHKLNVPVATGDTNALSLGVTPFLIGDAIKLVLAGTLLPAAWALANRKSS